MEQSVEDFKTKFKKRCFHFSIAILHLSKKLRQDNLNWPIIDQLIKSATSIGANIVEGGNSSSKKEFINFFQIALKSTSETLYWLALLLEINSQNIPEIKSQITECSEIKETHFNNNYSYKTKF